MTVKRTLPGLDELRVRHDEKKVKREAITAKRRETIRKNKDLAYELRQKEQEMFRLAVHDNLPGPDYRGSCECHNCENGWICDRFPRTDRD